jgi:hypothetical protein
MDIDSIGRVSDAIIIPIATPPAAEEPRVEPESQAPETVQDTSKILDLYA